MGKRRQRDPSWRTKRPADPCWGARLSWKQDPEYDEVDGHLQHGKDVVDGFAPAGEAVMGVIQICYVLEQGGKPCEPHAIESDATESRSKA